MDRVDAGGDGAVATAIPAPAGEGALDRRRMNLVFVTVLLGMLLAALDQTIVSTALPTIVGDLGGAGHLSWVVSSYLLADTIATVLAGKVGDLFGRKRVFQVSAATFVLASAACGLAQTMSWLVSWRAVQGFGAGGLTVTATALIADVIPLRERGKYQGALGAVFGVTTVLGPLVGGLFTDHLSWRWAFYVNLPIGVGVIALAAVTMPAVRAVTRPVLDYLGIVFVSLGSAGLTLALSWAGTQYAWTSPTIIGLFVGSLISLVLFVVFERRAVDPILPLRLFALVGLQRLRRPGLHRRVRDARRDDLPADLPAVREGRLRDELRPADPAAGARPARHLDRGRDDRRAHRALQDLPRARNADHGDRSVPALAHGRSDPVLVRWPWPCSSWGSASGCPCRC